MAVKIICGYDDDDYSDYEWLFDNGHFDSNDWDYIIDGGLFVEANDFTRIEMIASRLEVYDSIIKEIRGRIYAVTYHG
jgi:hypothetical protein